LEQLTPAVACLLRLTAEETTMAQRAAALSKADLATRMVVEMTALQGIMGSHYARLSDESEAVAAALAEQYNPVSTTRPGLALSLADRLDSLLGLFAVGLAPKGSNDPFALRRAALGVIENLVANQMPFDVRQALAEWQDFTLASDPRTPETVRQVLSHWMFEHIHPVPDGNGRIGRLLVPVMLRRKGATRAACAFLGEAVHEDKDLYVEALKTARISADMTAWTRLMLSFLQRSAAANLDRLARLAGVEAQWRGVLARFRSDSMVHKLAPFALTRPAFTIEDARRAIGGTFASVNTAAAHLVDEGILVIADRARRDRLFLAGAVLDIFDRFRPLTARR